MYPRVELCGFSSNTFVRMLRQLFEVARGLRLEQKARGERIQVVLDDGEKAPGHGLIRHCSLFWFSSKTFAPLLDLHGEARK